MAQPMVTNAWSPTYWQPPQQQMPPQQQTQPSMNQYMSMMFGGQPPQQILQQQQNWQNLIGLRPTPNGLQGGQQNYGYVQPVGPWGTQFTGPFGTMNPFQQMPWNPNNRGEWADENTRGMMKSWLENWALPVVAQQQDWAKFVSNDRNWQRNFGEQQRLNTFQMGMTEKEFKEKLRLAGISEDQWNKTFGENQRQWNQQFGLNRKTANRQYGLDRKTLNQNITEQNRRYGLDKQTSNRQWNETKWQRGLSNRTLRQQKNLTQQQMRSDELQSRYQAFGRAQEPAQTRWSSNW